MLCRKPLSILDPSTEGVTHMLPAKCCRRVAPRQHLIGIIPTSDSDDLQFDDERWWSHEGPAYEQGLVFGSPAQEVPLVVSTARRKHPWGLVKTGRAAEFRSPRPGRDHGCTPD